MKKLEAYSFIFCATLLVTSENYFISKGKSLEVQNFSETEVKTLENLTKKYSVVSQDAVKMKQDYPILKNENLEKHTEPRKALF